MLHVKNSVSMFFSSLSQPTIVYIVYIVAVSLIYGALTVFSPQKNAGTGISKYTVPQDLTK